MKSDGVWIWKEGAVGVFKGLADEKHREIWTVAGNIAGYTYCNVLSNIVEMETDVSRGQV